MKLRGKPGTLKTISSTLAPGGRSSTQIGPPKSNGLRYATGIPLGGIAQQLTMPEKQRLAKTDCRVSKRDHDRVGGLFNVQDFRCANHNADVDRFGASVQNRNVKWPDVHDRHPRVGMASAVHNFCNRDKVKRGRFAVGRQRDILFRFHNELNKSPTIDTAKISAMILERKPDIFF